ncbi:hypothetical protein NPIL_632731 [Nephila pilipes]|uniref:Uncharacterized protein n=1 Tax=Nephila pilipes TaxID=299642 RepID=A0A8X6P7E3_NEPPI|nr:hypothetical protein NPIL_632731 [Nephila pilipes]
MRTILADEITCTEGLTFLRQITGWTTRHLKRPDNTTKQCWQQETHEKRNTPRLCPVAYGIGWPELLKSSASNSVVILLSGSYHCLTIFEIYNERTIPQAWVSIPLDNIKLLFDSMPPRIVVLYCSKRQCNALL